MEYTIKYTTEPSETARRLYQKNHLQNYDGEYTNNYIFAVISVGDAELGVIGLSPVASNFWTAHIISTYPLLGNVLRSACQDVISHLKKAKSVENLIIFPRNKLAWRLGRRLGFIEVSTEPSILIRKL